MPDTSSGMQIPRALPKPKRQALERIILLVDDDSTIRQFTKIVLERAGYKVLTASDGEEGLRLYRTHRDAIQLLLSDLRMPKMNGIELADQISQTESDLPILLMSGESGDRAGHYECLEKPVPPAELLSRVSELTGQPNKSYNRELILVAGR